VERVAADTWSHISADIWGWVLNCQTVHISSHLHLWKTIVWLGINHYKSSNLAIISLSHLFLSKSQFPKKVG
jgi:hypothetical protein